MHILDFLNYFCNGQRADKWVSTCFQDASCFWWPVHSGAVTNAVPFSLSLARPGPAVDRGDRLNTDYSLSLKAFQGSKANPQETANTVKKSGNRVGHQNPITDLFV